MANKSNLMKSQSGQILAYTIIIIMLAALIIGPLLQFTYSTWRAVKIREERTLELYAADTGIEDALFQIKTEKKGTELANLGFGETFNAGTPPTNDRVGNTTIQKIWLPEDLLGNSKTDAPTTSTDKSTKLVVVGMLNTVQATAVADDFSSGWPNSGTGNWTGSWTTTGNVVIGSGSEGCDSGNCLKLADVPSTATRTANLLKYMKPQIKFTARASSLEAGDTIDLNVTFGGSTRTLWTWADGSETSDCTAYDFDLYDLYGWEVGNTSVPLQITFDAHLSIQTVAQHDFSGGAWTGGSGWVSNSWTASSSGASVVSTGSPHSDSYHVKLSSSGYAMRRVSLASVENPQITVWAKTNGFGSSDRVYLKVTNRSTTPDPNNGSHWPYTLQTWSSSSSGSYTSYTYNLPSAYAGQSIWILFSGSMSSTNPTIASDGFESGWPNSGSGWAGSWATSTTGIGAVSISTSYTHGGSRALQLSRSGTSSGTATVTRTLNVSGQESVRLQFYARSRNIESSGDTLTLQVSRDNVNWTPTTIINNTSYNSGYGSFTYDVPQSLLTTGVLYVRFYANMTGSSSDTSDYFYIDDINIIGSAPSFYFDDVSITEGDSFYADNIWIGSEYNSNTIEIAYIDPNFDPTVGSPGVNDPAYLDRIGVWMPPGCNYVAVVGNETTVGLRQEPTTTLLDTYAGGTILEWDFTPNTINLGQPIGAAAEMPIVRSLTFAYSVDVTQDVQGMFVWIKAHGDGGRTYISWDKGYEIYKAVSQAYSEIFGSNTQVTAYVAQGETDKQGAAAYGNYVATGNPLLIDRDHDSLLAVDYAVDPATPGTWVTEGGVYYDGRSEITAIPSDAKVVAGWLYWAAFVKYSAWSAPDEVVDFMYPKRYGSESFTVTAGDAASRIYTVNSYKLSPPEPMDLLAHEPVLTLSNMRYLGEVLGTATVGNATPDTFFTAHKPISPSPAPNVWVGGQPVSQSGNYAINYVTGEVTIINDSLYGSVIINYSVPDLKTLVKNTDYTINQVAEGTGYKYTGFTITNSDITLNKLQGTVTIDCYYAKHWQLNVQHAAQDRYGTALGPVSALSTRDATDVGWYYACFADVTDWLTGNDTYTDVTGKGQYAVNDVTATPGDANFWTYRDWCYSGWSLILLYESPSETAHQFYLYDPIHNADVPFMVAQALSGYHDVAFTLTSFYPPEGMVDGRLTYFVGEGDDDIHGDSIGFKGASQTLYTSLYDAINPENDVMNSISTTGEKGVDVDTFNILGEVGSDTSANVRLRTQVDGWQLVYMILSFKTNQVPKAGFAFDVASVTYQYELNQ